ncbi:leucyl aminopeptidase [Paenibacillus gansuensis]|uniref:Probable cytosol aminopeptidase n=1 Tax=Paenibacillus gansuensis TaxID=306542 RepID=A0ABW5P726_9BACL
MYRTSTDFQRVQAETFVSAGVEAEAVILYISKEELEQEAWINDGVDHAIRQLRDRKLFKAEPHEAYVLPTLGLLPQPYVILIGIGGAPYDLDTFRDGAIFAAKAARKHRIGSAAVSFTRLPAHAGAEKVISGAAAAAVRESASIVRKAAEGFVLGEYTLPSYAEGGKAATKLKQVTFILAQPPEDYAVSELQKGVINAESTNYARDLTNLPGNMLTPQGLAEEAVRVAQAHGMKYEILDETSIEEKGMGGLLAVGKGSVHPPRMITVTYQGKEAWTDVLGLVGKGVTFDTGGISLKKGEGMEEMISDMGGAATLLGMLDAVGRLKPEVNLVVVIPAAENMPAGNAFKPGDIITSLSGRTIEVLNTDAEGRIVLADGMTYAKQLGAAKLIDVATLTGAILVNFADVATGAVTNDETFLQDILTASRRAGEKVWPLPSYPEYWNMLKSDVADLKNAAGRHAAAITGGLFIGTFADGLPWVHLDTGGTAWLWSEKGTEPKGATGSMVRTLIEMLTD